MFIHCDFDIPNHVHLNLHIIHMFYYRRKLYIAEILIVIMCMIVKTVSGTKEDMQINLNIFSSSYLRR